MSQILFRQSLAEENELEICRRFFDVKEYRTDCKDSKVIGRYSCLPFYKELEKDLYNRQCTLINRYYQHKWIADYKYYEVLKEYMPKSWTDETIFMAKSTQKFIVKGATNSKKTNWKTLFAPSRKDALLLASDLKQDSVIGAQEIIYKEYVELEDFGVDCTGIPIANEWRFFLYQNTILTYGYYWSNFPDIQPEIPDVVLDLANKLKEVVCKYVNFYVLDLAKTKDGKAILIEVNDGQMSGLSNCSAEELYKNLYDKTKDLRWDGV
jgi:hypothetical protein